MFHDTATSSEARANMMTPARNTRLAPNRPIAQAAVGVMVASARKYAVATHWTTGRVDRVSSESCGRATLTMVPSMPIIVTPSATLSTMITGRDMRDIVLR
jgi:hypothetical protein